MTTLPIKAGIDGLPTNTIPTDPAAFIEWFKNSYLPRWAANADIRNATPGTGVQISGNPQTPGFVGFEEIAGNSVLGNPTAAEGDVQAITAGADGEFLQRAGGALVFGPVSVVAAESISGTGSLAAPLELVNDALAPGNSQYYGTSSSGTKGFFPIPTAAPGLPGTIPDLTLWWESDNILGAAGAVITRLQERTPWITGVAAATAPVSVSANITPNAISSITINSLPTVKIVSAAGGVQGGYLINNLFALAGGATFFVVMNPNNSTSGQAIVGGTGNGLAFYLNGTAGSPKLSLVKTSAAIIGTATPSWTAGTAFQANATYVTATGAFAFRQSRAAAGSGTGTTGAGSVNNTSFLFADSAIGTANPVNSSIAAVIIYNRVLTLTEITNVENYLFAKWGV